MILITILMTTTAMVMIMMVIVVVIVVVVTSPYGIYPYIEYSCGTMVMSLSQWA